jgi:hypothetical protein
LAGRFELWAACNAGNPQFVNQTADGQNNGNNFEYPDLVSGQKATVGHRTVGEWFSPKAFQEAVGHYGDIPRNPAAISAPANNPVTLAVNRAFPMPWEGHQLLFRAEAFNAFNHSQFGAPNAT